MSKQALIMTRREVLGTALLPCLVAFRIMNALIVRTYFNPDEYWQSLEIAHNKVFGYGYLTWEWQPASMIRGYAHPMIFAFLYKLLALLNWDSRWAVAYGPRILQGLFSGVGDWYLYKLSCRLFNPRAGKWALFCQVVSWFNFYCSVRTFSSSLETVLMTVALTLWPWRSQLEDAKKDKPRRNNRFGSLIVAAAAFLIRPSNAVLWVFLGVVELFRCSDKVWLILGEVLPISFGCVVLSLAIDRVGYDQWTFVPWNFVKFNILEAKAALYGVHPWYWYFSEGYPAMVGSMIPFFLYGVWKAPSSKRLLLYVILWGNAMFSFSAHKEFRFVLPLLPPAMVFSGFGLSLIRSKVVSRLSILLLLLSNGIAAGYLSLWHQAGPIGVMDVLSNYEFTEESSIHFLMPCHSTPYFSHLHKNIRCWFPDCSPINRERPGGSESEQIVKKPSRFIEARYQAMDLPEYVVMFSSTAAKIRDFLAERSFTLQASVFHAHVSGDADDDTINTNIVIYKRQSLKQR